MRNMNSYLACALLAISGWAYADNQSETAEASKAEGAG